MWQPSKEFLDLGEEIIQLNNIIAKLKKYKVNILDFENPDCRINDVYYDSEKDEVFITFERVVYK